MTAPPIVRGRQASFAKSVVVTEALITGGGEDPFEITYNESNDRISRMNK